MKKYFNDFLYHFGQKMRLAFRSMTFQTFCIFWTGYHCPLPTYVCFLPTPHVALCTCEEEICSGYDIRGNTYCTHLLIVENAKAHYCKFHIILHTLRKSYLARCNQIISIDFAKEKNLQFFSYPILPIKL